MTEKTPSTLDRLWEDIPTGHAPVGDILQAGHAAKRRQRRSVLAGTAAVTALLVAGGAITANLIDDGGRTDSVVAPIPVPTHTVTVHTTLDGPKAHYFEGASTEVSFESGTERRVHEPMQGPLPSPPGWSQSWADLPAGRYDLTAAVRPCNGSCESLGAATDSCQHRVDVDADTEILVTFHYGQPCRVTVIPAGDTVVPSLPYTPSALEAKARLEEAGFAVVVKSGTCPPPDACVAGVVSTTPAEGSIVPEGAMITLNVY